MMFLDNINKTQNRYYYKTSSRKKQNATGKIGFKHFFLITDEIGVNKNLNNWTVKSVRMIIK